MKYIIKTINLENLPDTRPLIAMDQNGEFFYEGKSTEPSYIGLKFTSTGNSTISLSNVGGNMPDMKYSLDDGKTWTQWDYSSISLSNGQSVIMKGDNPNGFSCGSSKYSTFVMTGSLAASGNIMSLIDNGLCQTLIIPNGNCYNYMFQNCTSLTNAPELPATSLADDCYWYMFSGCTSLTNAPELPATTLHTSCYFGMFTGCTSLSSAPELPATTLATRCYFGMFYDCTSLTNAPELPATTLANYCYSYMFQNCTGLTSAPELPATTLRIYCYYYMFQNCTGLTNAPELPATTLAKYCYYYMFNGCTSLNYIKCLATSGINTNNSTTSWISNVASSGTFIKEPNATWPIGDNGIPTNWTVENVVQS